MSASGPMATEEIVDADRQEWKKRALAAEELCKLLDHQRLQVEKERDLALADAAEFRRERDALKKALVSLGALQ